MLGTHGFRADVSGVALNNRWISRVRPKAAPNLVKPLQNRPKNNQDRSKAIQQTKYSIPGSPPSNGFGKVLIRCQMHGLCLRPWPPHLRGSTFGYQNGVWPEMSMFEVRTLPNNNIGRFWENVPALLSTCFLDRPEIVDV